MGGQFYGKNHYKQNFRNPQKFVRKIPYKGTDTLQIKFKKSRFPYGYSFSLMQPPNLSKILNPYDNCCAPFPHLAFQVFTFSMIYIRCRKNKGPKKHHLFFSVSHNFTIWLLAKPLTQCVQDQVRLAPVQNVHDQTMVASGSIL